MNRAMRRLLERDGMMPPPKPDEVSPDLIPLGEFWTAYLAAREFSEHDLCELLKAYILHRTRVLAEKTRFHDGGAQS